MKTILLSVMFHNDVNFIKEWEILRNEYNKIIKKHHLPIKILGYCESNNSYVDRENDVIYVSTNSDRLYGKYYWFEKNVKYFFGNFDYYIKTNTSTIVNLQLLNAFVQSNQIDDNLIYTTQIYHIRYKPINDMKDMDGLSKCCPFGRGNFLLMSSKIENMIIKTTDDILSKPEYNDHTYIWRLDDRTIGQIVNEYFDFKILNNIQIFRSDSDDNVLFNSINLDDLNSVFAIQFKDYSNDRNFENEFIIEKLIFSIYENGDFTYQNIDNLIIDSLVKENKCVEFDWVMYKTNYELLKLIYELNKNNIQ